MNITSIGEILFDIYPNHKRLGGAPLNFIYHVKKLTDSGNIISRVGKDVLGNKAINDLKHSGLSFEFIQHDNLHSTGMAIVHLDDSGSPTFKIDTDSAYDFIELNDDAFHLINADTDCLYFGTLAQRSEISRKTIQSLFNRGLKYFADLNLRQNFYNEEILTTSLEAADFIKVNYEEMHMLNDLLLQSEYHTEKVAYELMEKFEINMIARTVTVDGVRVELTPKEYDLLFYLVNNKNIALSREKLLSDIWGYDFFGDDRTIDTHIKNLRNNLGNYRDYIITLSGVGYKFEV